MLPAIARRRYKLLLNNQVVFENESEKSSFNQYIDGPDKTMGIITTGIAYNYLMENYPERIVPYPVLKIGQYPLPRNLVSLSKPNQLAEAPVATIILFPV